MLVNVGTDAIVLDIPSENVNIWARIYSLKVSYFGAQSPFSWLFDPHNQQFEVHMRPQRAGNGCWYYQSGFLSSFSS